MYLPPLKKMFDEFATENVFTNPIAAHVFFIRFGPICGGKLHVLREV